MVKIYAYIDYRLFLKDFQEARHTRNKSLSVRSFLQQAGIKSPSFFKQVIDRKRNLTERTTQQFLQALKLPEAEAKYFRAMVGFDQAKSSVEKQMFYQKLRDLGEKEQVKIIGADAFAFYEHWYISAMRELICMQAFDGNFRLLGQKLSPPISAREARHAVKTLLELGFIVEIEPGIFQQKDALLHTGFEVQSLAVRNFNRQMLKLAQDSLDRFAIEERTAVGVTLSVSPETYELMQTEIRTFQDRILQLAAREEKATQTMQLCVSLFPLTKLVDKAESKAQSEDESDD